ncbi:MAG: hypothetical protein ABJN84_11910 [Flavobacteriaceae bacterium]
MKSNIIATLVLILLICFSCTKKTAEIYVSENGSDANMGSKEFPVQTMEKAQELAMGLEKEMAIDIIFEDGTYYLSKPVVFEAKH